MSEKPTRKKNDIKVEIVIVKKEALTPRQVELQRSIGGWMMSCAVEIIQAKNTK